MNYLKILVMMLLMTITFTGCKKDVDDILPFKTGEWSVTSISASQGTKTEIWVFHDNGHMDMGKFIDAYEWVYDKSNNSVLLKVCDTYNTNCVVMELFVKKSRKNEQEWVYEEGTPYQILYKLKRNR